jgi:hypothetical protein
MLLKLGVKQVFAWIKFKISEYGIKPYFRTQISFIQ